MESFTYSTMTEGDLDCVSAGRLLKAFNLFQLMLEYQGDVSETLAVHVNSLSERLGRKNAQQKETSRRLEEMEQTLAERDATIQEMREITEFTSRPDHSKGTPPRQEQRLLLPVEDISPIDPGLVHLSVVVTSEGLILVRDAKTVNPMEFLA